MKYSLFLLLISFQVLAQNKTYTIKGKILENQKPLAGVLITSNSNKTYTNQHGEYTLSIPEGLCQVNISHVGFIAQTLNLQVTSDLNLEPLTLNSDAKTLDDIVVTGQMTPQSLKNSVYNVRVISPEQIKARGAANLQTVLNTELGIRFTNDLTLGTSDIELLGMSGQNVKILLDGIPLIDRGATRESLNQIDINSVERIEIIEGPMSVNYGSDALAGVINIITSKNKQKVNVNARILEETTGSDYSAFRNAGTHQQYLSLAYKLSDFDFSGSVTNHTFGGWQGKYTGRKTEWLPKEQLLTQVKVSFQKSDYNIWYRFTGTDETLKSLGDIYVNTNTNAPSATDQFYISKRWLHQLQSDYRFSSKNNLSLALAYTDYSRKTQTTDIDLNTNKRTLALAQNQDKAIFNTFFARLTANHTLNSNVSIQHGFEVNSNTGKGERIIDSPQINDFAYYLTSEIKPTSKINLRPGLRFIHNSVYDAPPVIPSINTKFILHPKLDLRAAYARGFRSPALRELYFTFFDASHSIIGNKNLKAETSNSFNAFLNFQALNQKNSKLNSVLGGFYNEFNNLITIGIDPENSSINTYLNIEKHKTAGVSLNNTFHHKNLSLSLGITEIGRYNKFSETDNSSAFMWTSELNSNLQYNIPKYQASVNLFLKYTGKVPRVIAQTTENGIIGKKTEIEDFTMADLTINKSFLKYLNLNLGVKNLFNVKSLNNSNLSDGSAHATGGSVPMSYGRSYFAALNFQFSK